MAIYIGRGQTAVHFLPTGYQGAAHRVSACGSWQHHGRYPDDFERGSVDEVTCGKCKRTASFRVAEREEARTS